MTARSGARWDVRAGRCEMSARENRNMARDNNLTQSRHNMSSFTEWTQVLLDHAAGGQLSAHDFHVAMSAVTSSGGPSPEAVHEARTANETQMRNQAKPKRVYDYIVIGCGASGAIIAGELSKTSADVLAVESGDEDAGPTVSNSSIWFYNVGGAFDW